MSASDTITPLAYGFALMVALFSPKDAGKINYVLWGILMIVGYIADKVTP